MTKAEILALAKLAPDYYDQRDWCIRRAATFLKVPKQYIYENEKALYQSEQLRREQMK